MQSTHSFLWSNKQLAAMDHENKAEIWDICWNNMGSLLATCGGDRLINLFAPNKWIPNFKG